MPQFLQKMSSENCFQKFSSFGMLHSAKIEKWPAIAEINKPRTAKVGAISKAQNSKRGPPGFVKLQLVAKYKKIEGEPFRNLKKFPKKAFSTSFLKCHSAEKCKRGDPLGFFNIHCVAKCWKKWRDPLVQSKKFQKSRIVPKKSGAMGGSLVWFRSSGRLFCFFFSFWTRFWGSSCWDSKLLRFDVEQMNKKVDLTRLKKLPTEPIHEPQIYVVVEQFGAGNISLLSGRLVENFPLSHSYNFLRLTKNDLRNCEIIMNAWSQFTID